MDTRFIEVTNAEHGRKFNWGKFMVARFTVAEWARQIAEPDTPKFPLLATLGWTERHVIVFDLQTCEGAAFLPGGLPEADLHKHKIWVCPLFEPFLAWLYDQDLSNLDALPEYVNLADAPSDLRGYRRTGPDRQVRVREHGPQYGGERHEE
jgi:hypothetical protein